MNLYFCKTLEYEPIDWTDYFINSYGGSYVVNWSNNVFFDSCPVTLILDFAWGGNIMVTDTSDPGETSDTPPINSWTWQSTKSDAFILTISTKNVGDCKQKLINFITPNCN